MTLNSILRGMEKFLSRTQNDLEIERLLASKGIIPTPQRIDIAKIMLAKPQHLSADQVLELVNGLGQVVSKATVYNTLKKFADCGLVSQVIVDPAKVFYDSNTCAHYHLYDVESGELTDLDVDKFPDLNLPEIPGNAKVERIEVVVRVRKRP